MSYLVTMPESILWIILGVRAVDKKEKGENSNCLHFSHHDPFWLMSYSFIHRLSLRYNLHTDHQLLGANFCDGISVTGEGKH